MNVSGSGNKTALIVVLSNVATDPRVRRQISWLASEGWVVDTLGLGPTPDAPIRDHFSMANRSRFSRSGPVLGLTHLLPYRARFFALSRRLFPKDAVQRVRRQEYDLIIFNDTHLLPWLADTTVFPPDSTKAHIHLDIHEYFPLDIPKVTRGRWLMNGFYQWGRTLIGHPLISSRSVAAGMGDQYAVEFDIPRPLLVRNCPPYIEQEATPVDPGRIELVHHGIAAWQRGFKEMVDAMRLVDDRFVLTFMLAGNATTIAELRAYIGDQKDRIFVVPPVPMSTLSAEVNKYDTEVMFFPPNTQNAVFGLPNKIFEAIQGRLALVIGPTALMVDIVVEAGNGVVTRDWTPEALAEAINSLSAEQVTAMKQASSRIAPRYSAEKEKETFFKSFDNPDFDLTRTSSE
jgi:glycosyltransferase involved in cell wall biosynthesis